MLREADPVHWCEELRGWVLTRHHDVKLVLGDPRFSADRIGPFLSGLSPERRERYRRLGSSLSHWVVFNDPPRHGRLRSLQSPAFAPPRMAEARPLVERIVEDLLDRIEGKQRIDFVAEVAYPLPVLVIALLLGVPTEDIDRFRVWSDEMALFIGSATGAPDKWDRAQAGLAAMEDYFVRLVEKRRGDPRNDLLTALIHAEEDGDRLSREELLTNALGLLFAGHETTTNLLGNGLLSLLRAPDRIDWLREDPERVADALEELLRYDGPVGAIVRVAREEVELEGRRILPGRRVFAMINAANRDPLRFPEPDRLDLARRPNPHLAFGHGIHYCLGAPLARLEGEILFRALLRRFPRIALADGPLEWRDSLVLRGLKSLPILPGAADGG